MTNPQDQFIDSLKSRGFSLTKARLLVFRRLQGKEPQTMQELLSVCSPEVDRATVYRTIGLLENIGVVQRLRIGWKYKLELTDTYHQHHHHLTCLRCGRTMAVHENAKLERQLKQLAANYNFELQEHQLELQGVCLECRLN